MAKEFIDLSNEFAFTFLDSDDIESKYLESEAYQKTLDQALENEKKKLECLANQIKSFINKLKSNPDKDTIKWPSRIADLNVFEQKIDRIIKHGPAALLEGGGSLTENKGK